MKYPLSVAKLALMVVTLLLLSCGLAAPSSDTTLPLHLASTVEHTHAPSSYREACNSTVYIYSSFVYKHNGWEYNVGGWGTGFVVGTRLIATNKHVALPHKFDFWYNHRQANPQGETTQAVMKRYVWLPGMRHTLPSGLPDYASALTGSVVLRQAPDVGIKHSPVQIGIKPFTTHALGKNDCALLQTRVDLPVKPLRIGTITDDYKGQKVYVLGYPRGPLCFETPIVNPAVSVGWVKKVEVYVRILGSTLSGNSGGPVVLEDGTVVGMIESVSKQTPTLGYAIRAQDFKKFLEL